MDKLTLIGMTSIIASGITICIGTIGTGIGQGLAIAQAMTAIAQQPDESTTIVRALFVGLAMIESLAIYCFVVSMILIFTNPFWNHFAAQAGG